MQLILNTHRLYKILASGILFCMLSTNTCAQSTIISQAFHQLNKEDGYTSMENIDGFDKWDFDNCYASHGNYMQIGSGANPYITGSVTTPALGTYGNVILLVKTARINDIAATFKVSVIGDGSISASDYTVGKGDYYRPSSILIKGCTSSTKIKIESTYGKFYLQTVKVYDIADAVFYESFNYMEYDNPDEFAYNGSDANPSLCDNYTGVEFTNTKLANNKIFFDNSGSYKMPTIDIDNECDALLTFRITQIASGTHTLSISATGGAKMLPFNSTDYGDLKSSQTLPLSGTLREWRDYHIIIKGLTNSTELTIFGRNSHLDDVKLNPIPSGLDQSKDNTTYIAANVGQERDVTLTRTITPNVWCPLCLPFDVTSSLMRTAMGETCELRTLDHINTSTGIFTFNNINENTTIEAGTPFLVKTTIQVINPTFTGVIISNTPASTISEGNYQFVGNYSPVNLETNGTNLFLGTDGNLYQPDTETGYNRLGGLRAYFVVPEKNNARVTILDEPAETTSIQLSRTAKEQCYYDFQGRKREATHYTPNLRILNGKKIIKK